MKKKLLMLLLAGGVLCLPGCSREQVTSVETNDEVMETVDDSEANEDASTEESEDVVGNDDNAINNWVGCSFEDLDAQFTPGIVIPDEAVAVDCRMNDAINMGEIDFSMDSLAYTFRVGYTDALEDISGMYYEWDVEDEVNIKGCPGISARSISEEGYVDVIYWYDEAGKKTLSLSTMAADLDGYDIQAIAEQIYGNADAEAVDESEESVDTEYWSCKYDKTFLNSREEDGEWIFVFDNPDVQTAGSDYVAIKTVENSNYTEVLDSVSKDYNDPNPEYEYNMFGAEGYDSYRYSFPTAPSEGSGLNVITDYTAIPVGDDVILIEAYTTVEPEDEIGYTVSGAFEYLLGTFTLKK